MFPSMKSTTSEPSLVAGRVQRVARRKKESNEKGTEPSPSAVATSVSNAVGDKKRISCTNLSQKLKSVEHEVLQERPNKKPRRGGRKLHTERDAFSEYMVDDVFLCVLKFFVPGSGLVDGDTLRSIMCVSKSWYKLASSRVLWSAAAGHAPTWGISSVNAALSASYRPSRPSFRVREVTSKILSMKASSSASDRNAPVSSLIGFANIGKLWVSGVGTWFKVRERATGRLFVVILPPSKAKDANMLGEISMAHYLTGNNFLKGSNDDAISPDLVLPKGVDILDGRLVRWYDIGDHALKDWHSKYWLRGTHISRPSIFHLQRLEGCLQSLSSDRKHVRADQWAALVDWIIEIVDVFDLHDVVAFQTMAYFDRFISLSKKKLKSRKYQLIAATCLHIASKCEGTMIGANDLSFCADITFGGDSLLEAEDIVLRVLEWKLFLPGIFDYASTYMTALGIEDGTKVAWMIKYLSELALQCSVYLRFCPSLIAACVLSLAFRCLEHPEIWPDELQEASGYSWKDLKCCMLALCSDMEHIKSTMPGLKMITRRYKKAERQRVGMIRVPSMTLAFN